MTLPHRQIRHRPAADQVGYTLVELLVAMAALSIIMLGIVMSMQSVQSAWRITRTAVREHQEGRRAIETISDHVSRAVLHTRWEPLQEIDESAPSVPTLVAQSDLHFVCGIGSSLLPNLRNVCGHAVFFQGPLGYQGSLNGLKPTEDVPSYQTLPSVLNAWGYYVEFGRDTRSLPPALTSNRQGRPPPASKHRFRLFEFRQPAHELQLFLTAPGQIQPNMSNYTDQTDLYEWFRKPIQMGFSTVNPRERRVSLVAENVLAIVIAPYDPQVRSLRDRANSLEAPYALAPDYLYDTRRHQWDPTSPLAATTRHQLPPAIQMAVIAIGEDDWDNLSEAEAIQQGENLVTYVNGMFKTAGRFQSDLALVETELNERGLSHQIMTRVFSMQGLAGRLFSPPVSSSQVSTNGP